MTTRTRLFAYHVIGVVSVVWTLYLVNPPLATASLGFAVVYLSVLAVLYLAGWAAGMHRRGAWLRSAALAGGVVALWLSMTAIDPGAGVFALLLAPVSLWPRRLGTANASTL